MNGFERRKASKPKTVLSQLLKDSAGHNDSALRRVLVIKKQDTPDDLTQRMKRTPGFGQLPPRETSVLALPGAPALYDVTSAGAARKVATRFSVDSTADFQSEGIGPTDLRGPGPDAGVSLPRASGPFKIAANASGTPVT